MSSPDWSQILAQLPLFFSKKNVTYAKIAPKMVNPRGIAGNAEEELTLDS